VAKIFGNRELFDAAVLLQVAKDSIAIFRVTALKLWRKSRRL
jgi:hypothetical protein